MVHVEIINKIVDAEKSARMITEEAKENLARLDLTLSSEYDALRASYYDRAERRITTVMETEQAYADEAIAKLDSELEAAIRSSEETAAKYSEQWVNRLFQMVIAEPWDSDPIGYDPMGFDPAKTAG